MRRAQQKEQTKTLLEQTAIELFKRQGYTKTTVSQITEKAGVAKGTFFNYFESKETILHTIREQQLYYMEQTANEIFEQNGSVRESLFNLCEKVVAHYEEAGRPLIRSLFHVIITDDSFQRKELLQSNNFKQQLIRFFNEGKKKNEFQDNFCSEQMSKAVLHHFTGILFYWCTNEHTLPLSQLIQQSIPFLFKGVINNQE